MGESSGGNERSKDRPPNPKEPGNKVVERHPRHIPALEHSNTYTDIRIMIHSRHGCRMLQTAPLPLQGLGALDIQIPEYNSPSARCGDNENNTKRRQGRCTRLPVKHRQRTTSTFLEMNAERDVQIELAGSSSQ